MPPWRILKDLEVVRVFNEQKMYCLKLYFFTQTLFLYQGVVSGTMLVTPNAIMFDPNVLDPLVKERGTSPYGVITQMDSVRGAAMYHDITAMNLKTATTR